MNINEIKAGMILKSSHSGIVVIVSNGEKIGNMFQGFDIRSNTYNQTLVSDYFDEISFHEAFTYVDLEYGKLKREHGILKHGFTINEDKLVSLTHEHSRLISEFKQLTSENSRLTHEVLKWKETATLVDKFEESIVYIGELKKFILHLQDYIAAKHLEENGLILEKFIQEEK